VFTSIPEVNIYFLNMVKAWEIKSALKEPATWLQLVNITEAFQEPL
jgi:hypothetical protein